MTNDGMNSNISSVGSLFSKLLPFATDWASRVDDIQRPFAKGGPYESNHLVVDGWAKDLAADLDSTFTKRGKKRVQGDPLVILGGYDIVSTKTAQMHLAAIAGGSNLDDDDDDDDDGPPSILYHRNDCLAVLKHCNAQASAGASKGMQQLMEIQERNLQRHLHKKVTSLMNDDYQKSCKQHSKNPSDAEFRGAFQTWSDFSAKAAMSAMGAVVTPAVTPSAPAVSVATPIATPIATPVAVPAGESKISGDNGRKLGTTVSITGVKEVGAKIKRMQTAYHIHLQGVRDPWRKRYGNQHHEQNADKSFNLTVERTFTE